MASGITGSKESSSEKKEVPYEYIYRIIICDWIWRKLVLLALSKFQVLPFIALKLIDLSTYPLKSSSANICKQELPYDQI